MARVNQNNFSGASRFLYPLLSHGDSSFLPFFIVPSAWQSETVARQRRQKESYETRNARREGTKTGERRIEQLHRSIEKKRKEKKRKARKKKGWDVGKGLLGVTDADFCCGMRWPGDATGLSNRSSTSSNDPKNQYKNQNNNHYTSHQHLRTHLRGPSFCFYFSRNLV